MCNRLKIHHVATLDLPETSALTMRSQPQGPPRLLAVGDEDFAVVSTEIDDHRGTLVAHAARRPATGPAPHPDRPPVRVGLRRRGLRPRRDDRTAAGRAGPVARLRTRSHPAAAHARARRTGRRPGAEPGVASGTELARRGAPAAPTRSHPHRQGARRPMPDRVRSAGRPADRYHPGHGPGTERTLSTTRRHQDRVGAPRRVATQRGHGQRRCRRSTTSRSGPTVASTPSAHTHRSSHAYSSASRPATRQPQPRPGRSPTKYPAAATRGPRA